MKLFLLLIFTLSTGALYPQTAPEEEGEENLFEPIEGFWIWEFSEESSLVLSLYQLKEWGFGRSLALYIQDKLEDSFTDPQIRVKELKGRPYLCNLDILFRVYLLEENHYRGELYHPEFKRIYTFSLTKELDEWTLFLNAGPQGHRYRLLPFDVDASTLPLSDYTPPLSLIPPIAR